MWQLGYGGGFYDRSIASLRNSGHEVVVIGIAFAGQQVDKVPTGPYDIALDAVWTPDGGSGVMLPNEVGSHEVGISGRRCGFVSG